MKPAIRIQRESKHSYVWIISTAGWQMIGNPMPTAGRAKWNAVVAAKRWLNETYRTVEIPVYELEK